jgi:glycosyltransferase involved in cell wall biosynthesis
MPSSLHIDSGPDWGGGQVQSLGLALALAASGEETWFIAQPGSELESRLRSSYLRWETMPLRGLAGLRSVRHLARRLAELQPDIIHIHESASHVAAGIAARMAARTGALPYAPTVAGHREAGDGKARAGGPQIIATRRTEAPLRRSWLGRAKHLLWCDRLICVSEAIRTRCVAAGLPDSLLTVIPDFVDCRHFDPSVGQEVAPATDSPTLLTVGRLTASKGHRVLLPAMREVVRRMPSARLLVCGRGEEEAALRRQAHALGLGDRVEFLGFAPDVRRVLAQADVFVMPSLAEGLGVAVLEAMAMAKPVVASDAGGLPESVVHGETGLVVAAGDAGALGEALLDLLNDPEKARRMGKAGRGRALSHYDRPRIVEHITALYERVLAGPT